MTFAKLIQDICDDLGIEPPSIRPRRKMSTPTTLAECTSDGQTVYIRHDAVLTPDTAFAIAHELRHVWQIRTDRERWTADYTPSAGATSTEEYNRQPAEVDAHAYALLYMRTLGIEILFSSFPEDLKALIRKRAEEIRR